MVTTTAVLGIVIVLVVESTLTSMAAVVVVAIVVLLVSIVATVVVLVVAVMLVFLVSAIVVVLVVMSATVVRRGGIVASVGMGTTREGVVLFRILGGTAAVGHTIVNLAKHVLGDLGSLTTTLPADSGKEQTESGNTSDGNTCDLDRRGQAAAIVGLGSVGALVHTGYSQAYTDIS